jgi:hypothetical protein
MTIITPSTLEPSFSYMDSCKFYSLGYNMILSTIVFLQRFEAKLEIHRKSFRGQNAGTRLRRST